jgi:hypothetical protein
MGGKYEENNLFYVCRFFYKQIVLCRRSSHYSKRDRPRNNQKRFLYISKYQIINMIIENNSESILNVNPNYFTLVSNMKASYSYSAESHAFKDKIKFLSISPLQSVDVYPGTITEGFLLFEKKYKNERPKKLFFKNIEKHIAVDVVLDKKVKK